jgi:hypothetical protein
MATTTNYGWTTPDNTDLVKDGALAIRTLGSAIDTTVYNNSQTVIKPNLIINGNFTINQRAYVSAANLASGAYGFDRWKSNFTNTTLTYTSAPAGQSVTINSGGGLQQIVEQANVPAGTYVLSWSGTATGRIYNVGATPPSYAASPVSFTADGLADVTVEFTAVGGTKTLSKVKLELGTSATSFTYAGGTIQGELANCQRYYVRWGDGTQAYAIVSSTGWTVNSTTAAAFINLPVRFRAVPTAVEFSNIAIQDTGLSLIAVTSASFDTNSFSGNIVNVNLFATGITGGRFARALANNSTSGYLALTAEL